MPEETIDFSDQIGDRFSPVGEKSSDSLSTSSEEIEIQSVKKVLSFKDSIEFSSKVLEILNEECEAYNKEARVPIAVNLLKTVYRSGANTYFVSDHSRTRSEWALARVYAFLNANKNKTGIDWEPDVNIMSESRVGESGELDMFEYSMDDEFFTLANKALSDKGILGFDFNSIHDIYMDDDGINVSYLKKLI